MYRTAIPHETILTIVSGKLETIKTADESDIVLRNIELGSSAETYIISWKKFTERYDAEIVFLPYIIDGQEWTVVTAKGIVEAFEYKIGPGVIPATISFVAPWNEEMICNDGDFLARPQNGDKNDIYRIEKETFKQTYRKIQ